MEKNLIFILFGIIFFNLIISICIIIKRRKKDLQCNKNISMLCNKIASQEKLINNNDTNLNSKINIMSLDFSAKVSDTNLKLSKTIENLEIEIKKSFNAAASHTNNVNKKLNESTEELKREINTIHTLLQKLKEETSNKSEESNKIISDIENKINSIVSNYTELRWQIENFTKIEEDSKRLNEDIDESQQEALIEAIVNKINANKKTHEPEQNQDNSPPTIEVDIPRDNLEVFDEGKKSAEKRQNDVPLTEKFPSDENSLSEPVSAADSQTSHPTTPNQDLYGNDISLDEEQAKALDFMENTTGNYFITGKAGTGKSFLLKVFQSLTQKTILKIAPTGIAALNIDGVTIHSAFGFNNLNTQSVETLNKNTLSLSPNKKLVLKNLDVLIIDEISMVRADIFDKIDKILRIVCEKENLPFGGKQVLVFGDLFQLPPIANNSEEKYLKNKYGGIFFFNSNSYKNSNFSYIELRTNHRQKSDQKFFEILNKIREGRMTNTDIDLINQQYVENNDSLRRVIKLYPKRELATKFNEESLKKILGAEQIYNAEITYNKHSDQVHSIENNFQISAALKLKIGAMVMMTRNDPARRWVNGTIGIVEKLEKNTIFVRINGITYEIGRVEFEMNEAIYDNGTITYQPIFKASQFPMILAYAITIHKSQGSTYQQIACDPSDCFAPGQAYVALSRCVDLKGVHLLNKIRNVDIKVDSQVREFYLNNTSI